MFKYRLFNTKLWFITKSIKRVEFLSNTGKYEIKPVNQGLNNALDNGKGLTVLPMGESYANL
jgi:hypothetical protein